MLCRRMLSFELGLLAEVLQAPRGNVFSVMHAVETDFHYRVIRSLDCVGQIVAPRGNRQHSPTRRVIRPVTLVGARMKDFHTVHAIGIFNSSDALARLEGSRIA